MHKEEHHLRNDQQDKTMTQQTGELTRDEMTQRQDVNEIGVGQEHDRSEDKMIYVKHQGRLQPMTGRDVRPLTSKNSDVYVGHGGKILERLDSCETMRLFTSWTRWQVEETRRARENRVRVRVIRAQLTTVRQKLICSLS